MKPPVDEKELDTLKAIDAFWRAALYVLTTLFPGHAGVWSFVDAEEHTIDFPGMLNAGWSHGELLALQAAANLFDGGNPSPALDDLCAVLDDEYFETVMQAIRIRRRAVSSRGF